MAGNELNHRQKAFALEYRKDHNGSAACIRAGYSAVGASTQAARLLKIPEIAAMIEQADAAALATVKAEGDAVLTELARIGYSDPIGIFNESDGTLKSLETMRPEVRRTIKSIKFEELFDGPTGEKFVAGRVVEVKFWDKVKSLELMGKNQGLFVEKVELKVDESLAKTVVVMVAIAWIALCVWLGVQ
jgi:hypothetical protein